jgi:hypothetical protein
MGVAWVDYLIRHLQLNRGVLFGLALIFLSGAFLSRKYRVVPVFTLVLILNALNIAHVYHQVLRYEATGDAFVRQAQKVRSDPSAKLWLHRKNLDKVFFSRISYYFHTDIYDLEQFKGVNVKRDYVAWGNDLLKVSDCASALREDLRTEETKWGGRLKMKRP